MKNRLAAYLDAHIDEMSQEELMNIIEVPRDERHGDYAFPCFVLAKHRKKSPVVIAEELEETLPDQEWLTTTTSTGPYVNFALHRKTHAEDILPKLQEPNYGVRKPKDETVIVEFSSPNTAKPFGIGHLRSTIIGSAIANIEETQGKNTVRINYLGDWGTQFAKLLLGYQKYGSEDTLRDLGVQHLFEIYVKINTALDEEELSSELKHWQEKLERRDDDAMELWNKFKELGQAKFQEIYDFLNVEFDEVTGESAYDVAAKNLVGEFEELPFTKRSEGALIADLEDEGLGVAVLETSDKSSIYLSRDVAAAIDRKDTYGFAAMTYEVGAEQQLHFRQLFRILKALGCDWADTCFHAQHGLYLDENGKKFSTRKGRVVMMQDILDDVLDHSEKQLRERYDLPEDELQRRKEDIARAAIIYGDLNNTRHKDMVFSPESFTRFDGETGPYILYSYARAHSVLEKAETGNTEIPEKVSDEAYTLMKYLENYGAVLSDASKDKDPSLVARYVYEAAQKFSRFYGAQTILGSNRESFRVALTKAYVNIAGNALRVLGITPIKEM